MIYKTPQYNTVLFTEVFEDYESFISSYDESLFKNRIDIKSNEFELVYALLYARYGNSPIANDDINQFKNKLFGVMFQYGPTWSKRLEIQAKLRMISDDELLKGGKAIYNNAMNPDGGPSTQSLEELPRINSQNTTNYKKSKMDAYSQLWELLNTDVTGDFINKFKICFKQFVRPEEVLVFYEGDED